MQEALFSTGDLDEFPGYVPRFIARKENDNIGNVFWRGEST